MKHAIQYCLDTTVVGELVKAVARSAEAMRSVWAALFAEDFFTKRSGGRDQTLLLVTPVFT